MVVITKVALHEVILQPAFHFPTQCYVLQSNKPAEQEWALFMKLLSITAFLCCGPAVMALLIVSRC
jgi:hypothetical protein